MDGWLKSRSTRRRIERGAYKKIKFLSRHNLVDTEEDLDREYRVLVPIVVYLAE